MDAHGEDHKRVEAGATDGERGGLCYGAQMVEPVALWARISAHAGEDFTLARGGIFSYEMFDNYLRPVGRARLLHRKNFEKALSRVPLKNTTAVSDVQGPSYVYAVLMDPRIRRTDW